MKALLLVYRWAAILFLGWIGTRTLPALAGEVRVPIGVYASGLSLTVKVNSMKELREQGLVMQQLDYSCGSAALATIFNSYLGLECTEAQVIQSIVKTTDPKTILQRKGFSLLDLKNYAESRGVTAKGYQLDYDMIDSLDCPVLLPLFIKEQNLRHFVIFLDAKEDYVYLADPARGRITVTRKEFEEQWNPRLGMIFSPQAGKNPTLQSTELAVRPQDDTHLATSEVLSLAGPSGILFVHIPTEF